MKIATWNVNGIRARASLAQPARPQHRLATGLTCLRHPVWHLESSAAWFTPTSGLARGRELPAGWLEMGGIEDTHGNLDAQGILDSIDNLGAKGADCANRSPRLHLSRLGHAVLASEAQ